MSGIETWPNIYINDEKMKFPDSGNKTRRYINPLDEQYGMHSQFREIGQNQNNIKLFQVPYKGMEIDLKINVIINQK